MIFLRAKQVGIRREGAVRPRSGPSLQHCEQEAPGGQRGAAWRPLIRSGGACGFVSMLQIVPKSLRLSDYRESGNAGSALPPPPAAVSATSDHTSQAPLDILQTSPSVPLRTLFLHGNYVMLYRNFGNQLSQLRQMVWALPAPAALLVTAAHIPQGLGRTPSRPALPALVTNI